ncbi:uncharacterized protein AB675_11539 [Cyphellophora attinorum]|uniref:C2H2-type domain-containing protein n=1 Tax=Cyphellophora attinorum TaxID=1664694 RepID=A0A0N1P0L5_9EURO|nr:uncharacterized protein AB675_11539 [Phialophora attinorum]KPI40207.1 hypothetical protein AB675_11539 [Phialophora attinorum]
MPDSLPSDLGVPLVKKWLSQQVAIEAEPDARAVETETDPSSEKGISTLLCESCVSELVYCENAVQKLEYVGAEQKRKWRDVRIRFRLFGGSFEGGKLETCLDDDETLSLLLSSLRSIALVFTSGLLPSKVVKAINQALISSAGPILHLRRLSGNLADPLRRLVEDASGVLLQDDESAESTDTDAQEEPASREGLLGRALSIICHHVDMLMDLLPSLERMYRLKHSTMSKPALAISFHTSSAAATYINNIRDKFPLASLELINRLGEANWQRHERLRGRSVIEAIHPASKPFAPQSIFKDSALGTSISAPTLREGSVASHSSFASTVEGGADKRTMLRVPPMPDWTATDECPFCEQAVYFTSRRDWKMHVFADLEAYICTVPGCRSMFTSYATRKSWASHEINAHLVDFAYRCHICGVMVRNQQIFADHLRSMHPSRETNTAVVMKQAQMQVEPDFTTCVCRLCNVSEFRDARAYATHVGQHLEQIALITLPDTTGDEGSGEDDRSNETDASSIVDQVQPISERSPAALSNQQKATVEMPEVLDRSRGQSGSTQKVDKTSSKGPAVRDHHSNVWSFSNHTEKQASRKIRSQKPEGEVRSFFDCWCKKYNPASHDEGATLRWKHVRALKRSTHFKQHRQEGDVSFSLWQQVSNYNINETQGLAAEIAAWQACCVILFPHLAHRQHELNPWLNEPLLPDGQDPRGTQLDRKLSSDDIAVVTSNLDHQTQKQPDILFSEGHSVVTQKADNFASNGLGNDEEQAYGPLSSGHLPAVTQIANKLRQQYPNMSEEEIQRASTAQIQTWQRQKRQQQQQQQQNPPSQEALNAAIRAMNAGAQASINAMGSSGFPQGQGMPQPTPKQILQYEAQRMRLLAAQQAQQQQQRADGPTPDHAYQRSLGQVFPDQFSRQPQPMSGPEIGHQQATMTRHSQTASQDYTSSLIQNPREQSPFRPGSRLSPDDFVGRQASLSKDPLSVSPGELMLDEHDVDESAAPTFLDPFGSQSQRIPSGLSNYHFPKFNAEPLIPMVDHPLVSQQSRDSTPPGSNLGSRRSNGKHQEPSGTGTTIATPGTSSPGPFDDYFRKLEPTDSPFHNDQSDNVSDAPNMDQQDMFNSGLPYDDEYSQAVTSNDWHQNYSLDPLYTIPPPRTVLPADLSRRSSPHNDRPYNDMPPVDNPGSRTRDSMVVNSSEIVSSDPIDSPLDSSYFSRPFKAVTAYSQEVSSQKVSDNHDNTPIRPVGDTTSYQYQDLGTMGLHRKSFFEVSESDGAGNDDAEYPHLDFDSASNDLLRGVISSEVRDVLTNVTKKLSTDEGDASESNTVDYKGKGRAEAE